MHKSINRTTVRKVIQEVKFLRGLKGIGAPQAYGYLDMNSDPLSGQRDAAYSFDICVREGHLELVVDVYTASGRGEAAGDAWNVDQWDAEKIQLRAPAVTRIYYQQLVRIARLLLAGYDVRVDGTDLYLKGIPNAKRSEFHSVPTSSEFWALQHAGDSEHQTAGAHHA